MGYKPNEQNWLLAIFPSFQAADIIRHGAQSQGGGRKECL